MDTEDPYHYVRVHADTIDGREQAVLIVGGEDHKTGQAEDGERRYAALESWMRERFPMAKDVLFSWSGQVMETIDGLAYIGRNPGDSPNVYVATGDCGMGMTHGTIAGLLLSDLIVDRPSPWASLYDPSRQRMKAAGTFLAESLNERLNMETGLRRAMSRQHRTFPSMGEPFFAMGCTRLLPIVIATVCCINARPSVHTCHASWPGMGAKKPGIVPVTVPVSIDSGKSSMGLLLPTSVRYRHQTPPRLNIRHGPNRANVLKRAHT